MQEASDDDISDWSDWAGCHGTGTYTNISDTQPSAVSFEQLLRTMLQLQNFALNVAEKGFDIAVYNRSYDKTEACVKRAEKEGLCV